DTVEVVVPVAGRPFYLGALSSPALIGVGAIVGLNISSVVLLGGLANWWVAIPLTELNLAPEGDPLAQVWSLWSQQTRFLGVGAMCVGGVVAIYRVRGALVEALQIGRAALRLPGASDSAGQRSSPENRDDLPALGLASGILICVLSVFILLGMLTENWWASLLLTVVVLFLGFLFSAVAAYMAGLVGSSNNPVSGITIATVLLTAALVFVLGVQLTGEDSVGGPAAALLVGSIVCTAAAIGGDNMQDLKAGQLLGARPRHQQILQLFGVLAAAVVLPFVLDLLRQAYGFGESNGEQPLALRAPQATLMASVAQGVFGAELPWHQVIYGALLAVLVVLGDSFLEQRSSRFRLPVLAFAVGIYLPLSLSVPMALGGALASCQVRDDAAPPGGLLLAAGLITGEALMGIFVALIVSQGGAALFHWGRPASSALSLLVLAVTLFALRRYRFLRLDRTAKEP
ncbi:MAG: oligopeptide transporter, OPT family, partial [Polyangiaceae bacterium]|nr:oligopeptide transporter, OPT family [Polyangiaceae bacterium]